MSTHPFEGQPLRLRLKSVASEALLDAAEQVMIEKGYEKSTMQDIATVAGCAVGTLYVHFKNKEELFNALIQRHTKEIWRRLQAATSGVTPPLSAVEKLRQYVCVHLRYTHENAPLVNVFCTAVPMRYYDFQRHMGKVAPESHSEFQNLLMDLLREAHGAGDIRTDMTPETMRDILDGLLLTMVDQFNSQPERYTLEEQIRLAWEFIAGGIALKR